VRVWDLVETAAPRVLAGHDCRATAVAVSADGRTAVSDGRDRTVPVWDLAGDQEQARWPVDGDVLAVAFVTAVTVAGDIAAQTHARPLNHLQQHRHTVLNVSKGRRTQSSPRT
jgi:WD40 repeat protein